MFDPPAPFASKVLLPAEGLVGAPDEPLTLFLA